MPERSRTQGRVGPADGHMPSAVLDQVSNGSIPLTIGPDSPLWQGTRDDPQILQLARELIVSQLRAQTGIADSIMDLLRSDALREVTASSQRPPRVLGRLVLPGGRPGAGLRVSLDAPALPAAETVGTTTATDGSFLLPLPARLREVTAPLPGLLVQGANATTTVALDLLPGTGVLAPIELDQSLLPVPLDFLGMLGDLDGDDADGPHATPAVSLGDDDCGVVFGRDASSDRFPFSVLFRLSDPAVVAPTLVFRGPTDLLDGRRAELPAYGPINPALVLPGAQQEIELGLVERVPISRPLSVDGFRAGLSLPIGGMFGGTPLAGSLAIGYVVQLAQRWTPLGLALGDLVYSLPLAPGEQQRVAVVERTASSTVIDSETLDTTEAQTFSELDDTSTDATFRSAFSEAASGSSSMQTSAESSSEAGVGGIGLAAGPVVIGGGVASSTGSASTAGRTSTLMEGARSTTSDTAETTHAAVQRQASARRQAARTGMRLATASETDRVVTKVITNHNKTRALTIQYWEVLRLFDVTTTVEGTSLVCLVPMDVVRFLPPGEPPALLAPPADRPAVLHRYAELIGHADVLARIVPPRYRQGLTLITEFAGDPQAAVQGSGGDAEDVLDLSLTGRFLPFEDVFVTVVSKRGLRTPATLLTGPLDPLPTGMDAYATESELLQDLRSRRSPTGTTTTLTGSVVLPRSIPRQDVVGFEISRRFRTLDYPFIPVSLRNFILYSEAAAPDADLSSAFTSAADEDAVQHSYTPDELESLLGGPPVTAFSALAGTVAFAQTTFPGGSLVLPRTPYPVSSQVVPPVLGYTSVLEIEKTLQWCVRNTMTCSVAVFSSLTAEERAVLLERYELTLPPDEDGNPQAVPLLSCITNTVLGYFGNSMVLPFQIPFAATAMTTKTDADGHVIRPGLTTGDITDALTRFHTDGFAPPHSTIALPTKGVLGEAVLGHCPSAEKIDLTRFWNWQDSPGDDATDISSVSLPQGSLTQGLEAPDTLSGLTPVINNFSTTAATPTSSLAEALSSAAAQAEGFDAATLTNAASLLTQTGQTLDTAETARADALKQAADVASKAMDAAVSLVTGAKKADAAKPDAAKPDAPKDDIGTLSVFFAANSTVVEDAPTGTSATGQLAAITAWAAKVKAANATSVTVKGFAAKDDDSSHADVLPINRANSVKAKLGEAGLSSVTAASGGLLTSDAIDKCRRADATAAKPADAGGTAK
ncbi:MAG TPA: hypothetical protein VH373_24870 [Jatrophihabitantaceae bacterium]